MNTFTYDRKQKKLNCVLSPVFYIMNGIYMKKLYIKLYIDTNIPDITCFCSFFQTQMNHTHTCVSFIIVFEEMMNQALYKQFLCTIHLPSPPIIINHWLNHQINQNLPSPSHLSSHLSLLRPWPMFATCVLLSPFV